MWCITALTPAATAGFAHGWPFIRVWPRSSLIPCLQSSAKMSSTVHGLARSTPRGSLEYGSVQARWCRLWVSYLD
jgi:hypothetical protein